MESEIKKVTASSEQYMKTVMELLEATKVNPPKAKKAATVSPKTNRATERPAA